jgi:hypothetical protein
MTYKENDGYLTAVNAISCILHSLQIASKTVHLFLEVSI